MCQVKCLYMEHLKWVVAAMPASYGNIFTRHTYNSTNEGVITHIAHFYM